MRKSSKDTPDALTNELVDARIAYNSTVQSVITRATKRREVVGQTINDLTVEFDALASVVDSVRKS